MTQEFPEKAYENYVPPFIPSVGVTKTHIFSLHSQKLIKKLHLFHKNIWDLALSYIIVPSTSNFRTTVLLVLLVAEN
jgi:hypothetical protein